MALIKCSCCGRVLGKYQEGIVHVKLGNDKPQLFLKFKDLTDSIMFVCPSKVYTPAGRIPCGSRHTLSAESLN